MATVIVENAQGERAPRKAKVIIENEPVKHIRPKTTDSNLFVSFDGVLYVGHYLKASKKQSIRILTLFSRN